MIAGLMKQHIIPITIIIQIGFYACNSNALSGRNGSQLPDSVLTAICDGLDNRAAKYFEQQKDIPLSKWKSSGWNEAQRHSYPRIEYATVNLMFHQNIHSANIALAECAEYFINDPERILHRDNFHWHSEMALRLIEFFGQKGIKTAGLISHETEDKIFEAVWHYAKRRQEDQVGANTKAEADHEISKTWYIYESENHHVQSFTTLWHFSKLIKDRPGFKDRKYDDGRTAAEHYEAWKAYLKMYFTERAKKGIYIEMMSRDYNHKSVKGMFNVYDFTTDAQLKRKVRYYIDLYFTYWGEEQLNGISGGGKSRLYSDISPGTSEYGYLFFGIGEKPRFQSTLLSAMTTSYRPPLLVVDIACDIEGRGDYEIRQRAMGLAEPGYHTPPEYHMRTDSGGIVRYSYCTPEFIIGTAMFESRPYEDWAMISSQNQSRGIIFANNKAACILPEVEKIKNNREYNSVWSVQQNGTLICQKLKDSRGAGRMRIWFAGEGLGSPTEANGWVFAETPGAYAAVRVVDGGYTWEDQTDEVKGRWLVCGNEYSPVILEVDKKSNYNSFGEFKAKVFGNAMNYSNSILNYTGLYGDKFTFFADYSNPPKINGTPVNYSPAKTYDSQFLKADWNSGVVHIQKGNRELVLDFN